MRRNVCGVAIGVAVPALTGVACDDDPKGTKTRPTNASAPRAPDYKSPPYTRGIEVGRTYPYSLTRHCGIRQAMIDGTGWKASPVLREEDASDWPQRRADGHLKIVSKYKAVFSASDDLSATFVRADLPVRFCR
jgi:hypothetical protein